MAGSCRLCFKLLQDIKMTLESHHKLLLVEDEPRLAASIAEYLQNHQFSVTVETRGDTAVTRILETKPDLVILDLNLPGLDGLEVCREVRSRYDSPILMLTARDDSVEQVVGLEVGADDYVLKPVEPRLLLARIRALLRHAKRASSGDNPSVTDKLSFGLLEIDRTVRSVSWAGDEISLSDIEFELLCLLASHSGKIVDRDLISRELSGYEYDGLDRSVDIRISRLRKKLEINPAEPTRIKTVRGKGYLFVATAWD